MISNGGSRICQSLFRISLTFSVLPAVALTTAKSKLGPVQRVYDTHLSLKTSIIKSLRSQIKGYICKRGCITSVLVRMRGEGS